MTQFLYHFFFIAAVAGVFIALWIIFSDNAF